MPRPLSSSLAFAVSLVATRAWAADVPVSDTTELVAAVAAAQPGDVILLEDGVYPSTGITCATNGTAAAPITVRARNPLMAKVEFDALEGFKVSGDYWHFEGLAISGVCAYDDNCDHGIHLDGGVGFVLRGSRLVDFNAQVKVNVGASNKLPQGGLIEGNELYDTRPRNTANPVTKLDLDSGDDWVVRANFVHDYEKAQGDNVSYGAFLKCGGQRGLLERNLVLCSRDTSGGTRIGLSLGGGGCDPTFCEPSFDAAVACVEHTDGIVRNNIVASCSDVGIYVNASTNSRVLYNTIVGTAGIDFRFTATTGEARGNVLSGVIRNRDGSTATIADNLSGVPDVDFMTWYMDAWKGDLRQKGPLTALIGMGVAVAGVVDDYCGRTRTMPFDIGALQHSLGDCATVPPPLDGGVVEADGGTVDAAMSSSGGGGGGGPGNGTSPPRSGGCGCTLGSGAPDPGLVGLVLIGVGLLWLGRRRWAAP